ncbi:MAG: sigma-70 family RNA polymerase sigma factor [Pirellulales bacterium]|nr:sigma-70 family RNA polymerase sigma factor [Pirellulales bacterium]
MVAAHKLSQTSPAVRARQKPLAARDASLSLHTPKQRLTGNKPTDVALELNALRHRAAALKELEIDYIASEDFSNRKLQAVMLRDYDSVGSVSAEVVKSLNGNSVPLFVAKLYETELLDKAEESHLFRQMNYLRHCAKKLQKKLKPTTPDLRLIEQIQRYLQAADHVKGRIIQANMRLVVSIAKKFVDQHNSLEELVSDGNLSLIKAVEKFNYSLGNRFSTYATYAIQRNFYRTVQRSRKQHARFISDEDSLAGLSQALDTPQASERQLRDLHQSFERLLPRLNPREQLIIRKRFGFDQGEEQTFKDLGDELGVCKERIRQIQARAMEKLRKFVDEERLMQRYEDDIYCQV